MIKELVSRIKAISSSGMTRVAIDGVMASGKTSLAKEISAMLRSEDIVVLQASADAFFNSEETRYFRGFECAEGCYNDTFDLQRIRNFLLKPPSWEGKIIDILIFDGLFLQRPELIHFWDYKIFLMVDPNVALDRAVERDISRFESLDKLLYKHRARYIPAQDLYMSEVRPQMRANCIINNNFLHDPGITFCGGVSA
jgi:uridine kinase